MIQKLTAKKLTWLNIVEPTQDDLDYIAKEYNFHDLDLDDCRSKVQRPKIENYDDYKFLVLQFPVMQTRKYKLTMEEADVFLGKNYVITLHPTSLSVFDNIFASLKNNEEMLDDYFSKGPDYLLYKLLHEEVLKIFNIMKKISNEIDLIDNTFEKGKASRIIEQISALRRNIIFLQTSLKPQKVIFMLFENQPKEEEMDVYWGDIGDHIGKLLDMAEDYQELIEGLYSSIDTLLTYRMNNIMKTLTLFSVIMLPLTFITGFYGMNIKLPLSGLGANSLAAAGIVGGIMSIIAIAMMIFFKIRRF